MGRRSRRAGRGPARRVGISRKQVSPSLDPLGLGLLAGLVLLTAAFALLVTPRAEPFRYVGLLGSSTAIAAVAFLRLRPSLRALSPAALTRFALLTAACLRVAAALAPTSLSDDVHRYVYDGELVRSFESPYWETPAERVNRGAADPEVLEPLNSPKFISVYPPVSQAVFAWAVSWADAWKMAPDRWLRLLLGLFDLVTVWLLLRLLRGFGHPRELALLYAWNPLVFWELAGGGHTEAIALPFLALALGRALRGRWLGLGLALGLAALAKTTMLLAAPVLGWFLLTRRLPPAAESATIAPPEPAGSATPRSGGRPAVPWWQTYHRRSERPSSPARRVGALAGASAVCVAVLAGGYAPFWFDGLLDNLARSFRLYYGYFVFDSPLYALARLLLGYREGVTPDVADQVMPAFTIGVLVVLVVATLGVNGRSHRLPGALVGVWLAHLMLSPVFHPWYLLPAVFLGVLARAWAPLGLSVLVGVTYLAYAPSVGEVTPAMLWLQFAPFSVLLLADIGRALLGPVLRRRARRKYRAAAPWLPEGARVLDLGAGEGFVGLEAARDGHEVQLVDVVDHNRTPLPHVVYDGRSLPFDDGAFEVGLLAYVLHHCEAPEVVLREAARVCNRLVVLESVYETEGQRRLLTRLDHLANRLRGIPMEPLRFDRVEGWRARFALLGLAEVHFGWMGRFVHKHVVFVLDCRAGARVARRKRPEAGLA